MTPCEQLHAELGEYLEETLPGEVQAALDAHASGCAPCRVLVTTLHETMRLYRDLVPWPLPAAVHARLEDLLRRVRREAEEDMTS
ncbi:MAG: zf-HC2 domain-containing protein [Candidatus Xenobia bacterium]